MRSGRPPAARLTALRMTLMTFSEGTFIVNHIDYVGMSAIRFEWHNSLFVMILKTGAYDMR